MSTAIPHGIQIPGWVVDLDAFRRWARSDAFPDEGRICYLNGAVWVDMSKEELFSHNQVKAEYTRVLASIAKKGRRGRFWPDGARISNVEADISNQPDGIFVLTQSRQRIRLVRGAGEGYVELEGSPDMVLEIVSKSSVQKDTVMLMDLYWRAGIKEYWLVDAHGEETVFEIMRPTPEGYVPVRKQAGWQKSEVFGKSFKLIVKLDELGYPDYTLQVK